ncbi:hypothetical protein GCM10018779_51130 [Streptomyces griseocarneus]|nr:hypothetical protein GCM10018779_51130 [Streptomyces griseocarneus]
MSGRDGDPELCLSWESQYHPGPEACPGLLPDHGRSQVETRRIRPVQDGRRATATAGDEAAKAAKK